ncbi:hypothetical protein LJC33_08655 [Eubacteriales bacterium OttesenSCG-928-N13]|nr:hypothetical protein [Eubacteriales bacterium OttesenSCG-928-N13]
MRPKRMRYAIIIVAIMLVFGVVFYRLYDMQVVQAEDFQQAAESKTSRTLTLYGMRGSIFDSGMIPLAYDKRSFNVQFYRDPSRTGDADREEYTLSIIAAIDLIEKNGKKTITEFWLKRDEETGEWVFDTGTEVESYAARREQQWRDNFTVAKVPLEDLFDTLCSNYHIPDSLTEAEKLKVLSVWQQSRMYQYLSVPVTIAYDVDFGTAAEVESRSMELSGVTIAEASTRIYPKKSVAAHSIGYIAKISGEETMELYREKGYPNDAIVGMTGIEYSMEDQLSPYTEKRQGKRVVELNNRGKIIRELSYQAPTNGNDIVLTLNTQLQMVGEAALERTINGIASDQRKIMQTDSRWKDMNRTELRRYASLDQPVKTAETGAAVAIDPNNGEVLALVNYPTFDLSMFGTGTVDPDAWREVVQDSRNPMYNRAISTRDTPGSIFKLVTALGSLMEGKLTLTETISDRGKYKGTDTSYQPSCWIDSSQRYKHQDQTIIEGIKNSCNYFFYTIGQRLGSEGITKWAALMGLTSRTGIELPNESASFVGSQSFLYDADRGIDDQYTSKPIFAASMIKRALRRVGTDRGIDYDEETIDTATKSILDIVTESGNKDEWIPKIRSVLTDEMSIPTSYISRHMLVNEMFYYIQDLRWTANETIMAAIGQSITQVTPVAVSRYVAAVANGGTVYDLHLIDKIISPTGELVLQKQPVVVNQIYGADEYLVAIREGMREVTSVENDGTAASRFADYKSYKIAAKTGTAQRSKVDLENNSWLVTYAPYDDPQIVVVVYIQNGYAGARSAHTAISMITHYLDSKKLTDSITVPQTGRLTN